MRVVRSFQVAKVAFIKRVIKQLLRPGHFYGVRLIFFGANTFAGARLRLHHDRRICPFPECRRLAGSCGCSAFRPNLQGVREDCLLAGRNRTMCRMF